MASRTTTPSGSPRGNGRRSRAGGSSAPESQDASPQSRYRRTGWAFLILALAVVTGLREWFGVSGVAGGLLHHIAAGPVGALGVAMLRVHRFAGVHVRIAVGALGVLAGVTGIIQVAAGNPSPGRGVDAIEGAGGLLGWIVGYPLAVLFSSVGAVILFILLIVFSLLVLSGLTVADVRERLASGRGDDADADGDGEADSLALRLLDRLRGARSPKEGAAPWTPTTATSPSAPPWRPTASPARAATGGASAPPRPSPPPAASTRPPTAPPRSTSTPRTRGPPSSCPSPPPTAPPRPTSGPRARPAAPRPPPRRSRPEIAGRRPPRPPSRAPPG